MVLLRPANPDDLFGILWFMKEYQQDKGHTDKEYEQAVSRLMRVYPAYIWLLEDVRSSEKFVLGYVWATPWEENVLFIHQMYAPNHGVECYHQLRKVASKLGFTSLASIVTTEAQKKLFTQPQYGLTEVGTVLKVEL